MMVGIYRFYNVITGKSYIGQSIEIERRKHEHELCAFRGNEKTNKQYNCSFYQALREYGIDSFEFSILEICEEQELNEREIYWVSYYDSCNNGYNMTYGGDRPFKEQDGEKHHNHKLTEKQVYEIRERYNNHEYVYDVYEDYKEIINKTGFHKVWNGYTWKKVHMDVYTEENKEFHKWVRNSHPGRKTGTGSCLSKENIIDIRTRLKNGEEVLDIWKDYNKKMKHIQNFRDICNYKTYKNITV